MELRATGYGYIYNVTFVIDTTANMNGKSVFFK